MMAILKIVISGIVIWLSSELGKRSGKLGGLVLSLPLSSILAILWLWGETKDTQKIAALSLETLIFIIPSFAFFIVLSLLLQKNTHFYLSFFIAVLVTLGAYFLFFKFRPN